MTATDTMMSAAAIPTIAATDETLQTNNVIKSAGTTTTTAVPSAMDITSTTTTTTATPPPLIPITTTTTTTTTSSAPDTKMKICAEPVRTTNSSSPAHPEKTEKEKPQHEYNTGRWTSLEHNIFLKELEKYGKNWKRISSLVQTRSPVQIRTHAQKYFLKLAKANKPAPASCLVPPKNGKDHPQNDHMKISAASDGSPSVATSTKQLALPQGSSASSSLGRSTKKPPLPTVRIPTSPSKKKRAPKNGGKSPKARTPKKSSKPKSPKRPLSASAPKGGLSKLLKRSTLNLAKPKRIRLKKQPSTDKALASLDFSSFDSSLFGSSKELQSVVSPDLAPVSSAKLSSSLPAMTLTPFLASAMPRMNPRPDLTVPIGGASSIFSPDFDRNEMSTLLTSLSTEVPTPLSLSLPKLSADFMMKRKGSDAMTDSGEASPFDASEASSSSGDVDLADSFAPLEAFGEFGEGESTCSLGDEPDRMLIDMLVSSV